jgi:hypothetical protein
MVIYGDLWGFMMDLWWIYDRFMVDLYIYIWIYGGFIWIYDGFMVIPPCLLIKDPT